MCSRQKPLRPASSSGPLASARRSAAPPSSSLAVMESAGGLPPGVVAEAPLRGAELYNCAARVDLFLLRQTTGLCLRARWDQRPPERRPHSTPLRRASGAEFAEQELKNLVLQFYDRTTGHARRAARDVRLSCRVWPLSSSSSRDPADREAAASSTRHARYSMPDTARYR